MVGEATLAMSRGEIQLDQGEAQLTPTSDPVSTGPATESMIMLQVHKHWSRVPHITELARNALLVKREDITVTAYIGKGEFGVVYKALIGQSEREVAVKTLKGDFNQVDVDRLVEEGLKMNLFQHAHVMGLIGVCLNSGTAPYIIMQYMDNGNLHEYLMKEREGIVLDSDYNADETRKKLMDMCLQIASGMEYLAANNYTHRNLATRNCLINNHLLIKIANVGELDELLQSGLEEDARLPIKWMAPESLSDRLFSEKSDVLSYGVTMWEIFSWGKTPYPKTTPITLMQNLEQGQQMAQPCNAACTEDIYEIMRQCWQMAPEERPSFRELHLTISNYLECMASYLQMGPFHQESSGRERGGGP